MLIELWRKVLATDYTNTYCSVCGNDHDRGNVFPVPSATAETSSGRCVSCVWTI